MNTYFGYTRVSTAKQGQKGVSLTEQRVAIERYAAQENLHIAEWFEERETAAKRGRTVFSSMLKRLQDGEVLGVVIHKIDRSARNLRDWSDLADLMDAGVQVHFASGGVDMQTRGGRLSADIQAVVAADFIRNLKEETRKGFYGRLKQGIYPLAAPIGYLDNGGGQLKTHDPDRAPFIAEAFQLYATGGYTLNSLFERLAARGLRSKGGKELPINRLSEILNNPFYTGLIRIRTTGEVFQGKHEPIVSQALFDRVQDVLQGRTSVRSTHHDFRFKRLFQCSGCEHALTGERQKGFVYYRCHTRKCKGVSVREEVLDTALSSRLRVLQLPKELEPALRQHLPQSEEEWELENKKVLATLQAGLSTDKARLTRLTDALIDRLIERKTYDDRAIVLKRTINVATQEIRNIKEKQATIQKTIEDFFELWKTVYSTYKVGDSIDRRDLLLTITSNRRVHQKKPMIELLEPFLTLEKLGDLQSCAHHHIKLRTIARFIHVWAKEEFERKRVKSG